MPAFSRQKFILKIIKKKLYFSKKGSIIYSEVRLSRTAKFILKIIKKKLYFSKISSIIDFNKVKP